MSEIRDDVMKMLRERGYLRENEHTWNDLARRVAKALASAEEEKDRQYWEDEFYKLLSKRKFVNSTPTLMNAEAGNMGGLSSCFIIDIKDDLAEIHKAMGKCAKVYQYNGGVGFDISPLRPARSPLGTARGYAGGPVAFMSEFNEGARVATLYNERKSATKIDLQVWHPDIHTFIHCKDDGKSLTLMNISVSITDKFMEAVKNDDDWNLVFPDFEWNKEIYDAEWDGDLEKWLSKGYPIKVYETLKARDLFRELCESAWLRGDPGISFYDALNRNNPNKHIARVGATNPCAEFNSIPYTSCCLGSFNLMEYMREDDSFDMSALLKDVPTAVRILDNVITLNKYPLPEIEAMTKANRSIGIGIMGLADVMYKLGIRYGSQKSIDFTSFLLSSITQTAKEASHVLSFERGTYPNWKGSDFEREGYPVRNSDFTSIAPTGSISTICGVSSSVEPNFGLVYERHTADNRVFYNVNPIFEAALRAEGLYSEELLKKINENHGSCVGIDEVPKHLQEIFVTTHDVTPMEHIAICAAVQKSISLSVSKTVNLPHSATVEDVGNAYMTAYESGMVGITVYRDGCRESQVLRTGASYKNSDNGKKGVEMSETVVDGVEMYRWGTVIPSSDNVIGLKRKLRTGCGSVHVQCFFDADTGRMVEVYADRGGLGGCTALLSAVSRLISRSLRLGDVPEDINAQLQKTLLCGSFSRSRGAGKQVSPGFSCASAIGRAIIEMNNQMKSIFATPIASSTAEGSESEDAKPDIRLPFKVVSRQCPECKCELANDGGCVFCPVCGWSKCG